MKTTLRMSQTSKVWLQYMPMVDIFFTFHQSRETGNLGDSFECIVRDAAILCGNRSQYVCKICLQQMCNLPQSHLWAGLSPDLVIEQVLMKSM